LFGPALGPDDLLEGNRLGDRSLETITWGHWQSLNTITVIGAQDLRTTADATQPGTESEPASVAVLAEHHSGYTLTVDPRRAQLSRLPHDSCLTIIDPCLSRAPTALAINAAGGRESIRRGATVLAPGVAPQPGSAAPVRSPPPHRDEDIHIAPKTIDDPRPARPPPWWTFLIPIGIGGVLAVGTGTIR